MNYKVYFTSGNTVIVDDEKVVFADGSIDIAAVNKEYGRVSIINYNNVEYIIPEPQTESSVIKPLTPDIIKEQEKKKTEEIINDPKKLINDIENETLPEN